MILTFRLDVYVALEVVLRYRAQGAGLRAQGSGLRAQGSGLRMKGSGLKGLRFTP